jgi:hypothetical protein
MQILDYSITDYFILDSLPGETFKTVIHIKSWEHDMSKYEIDISNMNIHSEVKRCIDFILGI